MRGGGGVGFQGRRAVLRRPSVQLAINQNQALKLVKQVERWEFCLNLFLSF
jgi:hypothetical protein